MSPQAIVSAPQADAKLPDQRPLAQVGAGLEGFQGLGFGPIDVGEVTKAWNTLPEVKLSSAND